MEEKINKDLKKLLGIEKWLELNAKLQTKKNIARDILVKKGVLKKEGKNDYDNYKYFTEAQYKKLANELISEAKIEFKTTELEYEQGRIEGSKTPEYRKVKLLFTIFDCETGFYEESEITGEGLDRGDKAGYKAYTGAIKYFLADTFLVPTGDDAEKETPDIGDTTGIKKTTPKTPTKTVSKATDKQIEMIRNLYNEEEIVKALELVKKDKLGDLTITEASSLISKRKGVN